RRSKGLQVGLDPGPSAGIGACDRDAAWNQRTPFAGMTRIRFDGCDLSLSPRHPGAKTLSFGKTVELRVVLTVPDFDEAVPFYRDTLGLEQLADWSGDDGRVVLLDVGHATLELFDQQQAESVDRIEAGRRVSGPVRLALETTDVDAASQRLVAAGATAEAEPV